jgi:translation initiation factor 2-alpha kinase 4
MMYALKHIHGNRLVHRDINPNNIFVNKHNKTLLIGDFGLAKDIKVSKASSVTKLKI